MIPRKPLRITFALLLSAAVAVVATYVARLIALPAESFLPRSFVTHTVMLVLSLALMWLVSKGQPRLFGLTRGTYGFSPRILLWVLPTAVLSGIAAFASPVDEAAGVLGGLTRLQQIVFIWVYASACEEVLTRGLLQTLLSAQGNAEASNRKFSMSVVLSALFFGAMHIVLVDSMGTAAVPVIVLTVLLGLVAGRYREATGSLIPAIIVHGLFNVGGMLPLWVVHWLRS